MSYTIIENMEIQDGKVYVSSASNNVYPKTFDFHEAEGLSEIYQKSGEKGLFKWMAVVHRQSVCRFTGSNPFFRALRTAYNSLPDELKFFLDDERMSDFVAEYMVTKLSGKRFESKKRIDELQKLRSDKAEVLSICRSYILAFRYADESVKKDRDTAKAYIEQYSDYLLFWFPDAFANDKELAMAGLSKNGCVYRQLGNELRKDKDIIRMAFDSELERRFHEHIPSLIPKEVRRDKLFTRELVVLCKSLHVLHAPEILMDRETALLWVKNNYHVLHELSILERKFLEDPEFQNACMSRFTEIEERNKLAEIYRKLRVQLDAA